MEEISQKKKLLPSDLWPIKPACFGMGIEKSQPNAKFVTL
jgi:hypothetical protein